MANATTFEQIPYTDQERIKRMVEQQVKAMSAADRQALERSRSDFAFYVAEAVRSFAQVLGYMIALPFAVATLIIDSFGKGFEDGWSAAWEKWKI